MATAIQNTNNDVATSNNSYHQQSSSSFMSPPAPIYDDFSIFAQDQNRQPSYVSPPAPTYDDFLISSPAIGQPSPSSKGYSNHQQQPLTTIPETVTLSSSFMSPPAPTCDDFSIFAENQNRQPSYISPPAPTYDDFLTPPPAMAQPSPSSKNYSNHYQQPSKEIPEAVTLSSSFMSPPVPTYDDFSIFTEDQNRQPSYVSPSAPIYDNFLIFPPAIAQPSPSSKSYSHHQQQPSTKIPGTVTLKSQESFIKNQQRLLDKFKDMSRPHYGASNHGREVTPARHVQAYEAVHPRRKEMKQERKIKTMAGAVSGIVVGTLVAGPVGLVLGAPIGGYAANKISKQGERRAQRKYEKANFQKNAYKSAIVGRGAYL